MSTSANPSLLRFLTATLLIGLLAPIAAPQDVKYIILFIGDGMQMESEIAASRYLYGEDENLSFHKLPYKGAVSTWDITSYNAWAKKLGEPLYQADSFNPVVGYDPIRGGKLSFPLQTDIEDEYFIPADGSKPLATDSASSATAWATGYKTDSGNIAWRSGDPPDGALTTIAELLRRTKGFSIGVVSTVPFTHATPAAHVSHNVYRNNYHEIADEIFAKVKPDVVIGGGHPVWSRKEDNGMFMSDALYREFANGEHDKEYVFVERRAGVNASVALMKAAKEAAQSGKKVFGLYGGPAGNFDPPVPVDAPGAPKVSAPADENPLLKDAVEAALTLLSKDADGFFVLFEQGDIDWGAHDNDFARIVGTTWGLSEGVEQALRFVDKPGDDITWSNTLLLVTADHSNSYLRLKKRLVAGDLPAQSSTSLFPAYPGGEVTFATGQHTNELVRLYMKGPILDQMKNYEGVFYPGTKIIDNTQLFQIMTKAAGASVSSQ